MSSETKTDIPDEDLRALTHFNSPVAVVYSDYETSFRCACSATDVDNAFDITRRLGFYADSIVIYRRANTPNGWERVEGESR